MTRPELRQLCAEMARLAKEEKKISPEWLALAEKLKKELAP